MIIQLGWNEETEIVEIEEEEEEEEEEGEEEKWRYFKVRYKGTTRQAMSMTPSLTTTTTKPPPHQYHTILVVQPSSTSYHPHKVVYPFSLHLAFTSLL
ncbi:hypothetical protein M0802_009308 [Mischocyttarus mexicanus]|nr:hypothetical protein M0802_009308 [Mischocyttarus mexicanus]